MSNCDIDLELGAGASKRAMRGAERVRDCCFFCSIIDLEYVI